MWNWPNTRKKGAEKGQEKVNCETPRTHSLFLSLFGSFLLPFSYDLCIAHPRSVLGSQTTLSNTLHLSCCWYWTWTQAKHPIFAQFMETAKREQKREQKRAAKRGPWTTLMAYSWLLLDMCASHDPKREGENHGMGMHIVPLFIYGQKRVITG